MPDKFNFTVAALAKVACPKGADRVYVYDQKIAGLALCKTAAGRQSFYAYKWVSGRPVRVRIAGYPELSIEQARARAAEINNDIARGIDPQDIRRKRRTEATVGDLFAHYLETHAKQHKRTWKDDEAQFDRYFDKWRGRKLSTVKQADVQAFHAKLGRDNGPYTANRALALLHAMFNKAANAVGFRGTNPAHGIRKFKEQSRERFLQADELPRFFRAVATETNETIRDFVLIALLTGARRSNVQAMRWDEISIERATWAIPASKAKAGDAMTIHLSDRALAILADRKQGSKSEWVFPSHGATGHLMEPKGAWKEICKRAKISDLRLHDLRRTLGSWQAAMGSSLPIIGKSLGHKTQATTAIYARLNLDPVRLSVNNATTAMLAAANVVEAEGEVVGHA